MHSIVTTFREAVIKVEVANFGAAIDTLIDQDAIVVTSTVRVKAHNHQVQFNRPTACSPKLTLTALPSWKKKKNYSRILNSN